MKRFLAILVALACLFGTAAGAQSLPFKDDYEGINRAAGSVLMLLVYNKAENTYISTGSGFVAFDQSTLITNYHVVENGDLILAESDDGRSYFLDRVIAADKVKDIAILRFKSGTLLAPLDLDGETARLRGQPVVAIGSPEGYKNTVSKGDISSLFQERGVQYIQFTAPISSGSSGGALFNNQGQVIGITTGSVTGQTQNLNFAIDIKEAIALYEKADLSQERPISNLDGTAVKAEFSSGNKPSSRVGANPISNFAAAESQPGQVTLTWDSTLAAGQTYHIGFEIDGNPYYNTVSTQENTVTIYDLVPGRLYHFGLALDEGSMESPLMTASLRLAEALPARQRQGEMLFTGIYLVKKGTDINIPLPEVPEVIDVSRAALAGSHGVLSLEAVYRVRMAEVAVPSTGDCLYVLTTPRGTTYTAAFIYNFEAEAGAFVRSADLEDIVDEILRMEGAIEPGEWQLSIYHDAALLTQTSFKMGTVEAAPPETDTAQALAAPKGLEAFGTDRGVRLTWQEVPGAKAYLVYRATGKDGAFFYKDRVDAPVYLDLMAVKGREYCYQIEAIRGEEVSPRSESLLFDGQGRTQTDEAAVQEPRPVSYPLDFGNEAYVGNIFNPFINPVVVNLSVVETVVGFTLAYYCESALYQPLKFGNTDATITYYTYDKRIGPGQMINPGEVSMSEYGIDLFYIYLAISEVRLESGEVITIAPEDLDFYYWELN